MDENSPSNFPVKPFNIQQSSQIEDIIKQNLNQLLASDYVNSPNLMPIE
jgi:hypothetical protein